MFFPRIITRHPMAQLGLSGVESHLMQTRDQQLVFMSFRDDVEVPEHAHAAQWGVVLDGRIELTLAGKRNVFRKGDSYFIPAGVAHSARIHRGYKDLTLFDQRDRYTTVGSSLPRSARNAPSNIGLSGRQAARATRNRRRSPGR